MLYAILAVLSLCAFSVMSRQSKCVFLCVLTASLGYAYYVKFHTYIDFTEFKNLVRLLSLNTGMLALGVVLGLLRVGAENPAHYRQLRAQLLRFVLKWGGIYMLFSVVMTQLFNIGFQDESAGFLVMMVAGKYLFAAALLIYFLCKHLSSKKP